MSEISSGDVKDFIMSKPDDTLVQTGFFVSRRIYAKPKIGCDINATSSVCAVPPEAFVPVDAADESGSEASATAFMPDVPRLTEPIAIQFLPPSRVR